MPRRRDGAAAARAGKEVALLGGSFNPPHVAHLMAAWWTLATQGVSEVWLLPSYRHPFGKQLAPFEDRVRMCTLAAAALRGVHVCTAEADLEGDPLVGKTVRTLEYLTTKHPTFRFALVVGADILAEADKWYRFDRVRELARLIVVGRAGHPEGGGAPALPPISSTEVREKLGRGEDVSALVPRQVLDYIRERGLYRPQPPT
ncbi:MAG TPA: nicotinate (nicotinamide) nucleotide adenylyltransferase [Anaeromyxobacteraceae bacterium]|nr:nicotinate (nicotinamide) nucleotide adenylyltransferase [Anaeromyxobacteraceae bacterium]